MYKDYDVDLKNYLRERENYSFLLNSYVKLMSHKIKSDTVEVYPDIARTIEAKLSYYGELACIVYKNVLYVEPFDYVGELNNIGLPKDIIVYLHYKGKLTNVKYLDYLTNDDIFIMRNNNLGTPALELQRYANIKSEIQKSLVCNIINSRYMPIIAVNGQREKAEIDKVLANCRDGIPESIRLNFHDGDDNGRVLNITDVNASKNFENLSILEESQMKRLYTMYGCNINSSNKKSYQSQEEISDGDNSSMLMIDNMIKNRKKVKKWAKAHGIKWKIKVGYCIKKPYENIGGFGTDCQKVIDKQKNQEPNEKDTDITNAK